MNLRGAPRRGRAAPLTPMVDVVFLLLFFFMLASRFGADQALPLNLAGGNTEWSGPPRLVEVASDGVRLNGRTLELADLPNALNRLVDTTADPILIAPRDGVPTRELVAVVDALQSAGFGGLVVTR